MAQHCVHPISCPFSAFATAKHGLPIWWGSWGKWGSDDIPNIPTKMMLCSCGFGAVARLSWWSSHAFLKIFDFGNSGGTSALMLHGQLHGVNRNGPARTEGLTG